MSCVVVLFDAEDTKVLAQMVGRGGRNGLPCSCFQHADTRKSTWFGEHPECIWHALYSYVDRDDLTYMSPPSLDMESITATVRESIKRVLKERLMEGR